MARKIYVASSWHNPNYEGVTYRLTAEAWGRNGGGIPIDHTIMDWRKRQGAFSWLDIDPNWATWSPQLYCNVIRYTEEAKKGFQGDWDLMQEADTCVLLLPCGKSAHLEAGWFKGQGKELFILLEENKKDFRPELMYLMADGIFTNESALREALKAPPKWQAPIYEQPPTFMTQDLPPVVQPLISDEEKTLTDPGSLSHNQDEQLLYKFTVDGKHMQSASKEMKAREITVLCGYDWLVHCLQREVEGEGEGEREWKDIPDDEVVDFSKEVEFHIRHVYGGAAILLTS